MGINSKKTKTLIFEKGRHTSYNFYLNPLPHEHIVKMAVFIEKPSATSSNCFETMRNASILIKQILTGPLPL
jgi:hypothetical protein